MFKDFANKIIQKLNLSSDRHDRVYAFLQTVSYYKLNPYVDFIKNNKDVSKKLKDIIPACKDNWDCVVFLYRYNIKLSASIYSYIYLIETTLKTKINNELCKSYGFNWSDSDILNNCSKTIRQDIEKYKNKTNGIDIIKFVENEATFGFWNYIIKGFWNTKEIKLMNLFSKNRTINPLTLKFSKIYLQLESIRRLRNDISHYNRIIGCKVYKNCSLVDIYFNILYIFELLGYSKPDLDRMIGDLHCLPEEYCKGNSFEVLYKEFEFIHKYEIRADKAIKEADIEYSK